MSKTVKIFFFQSLLPPPQPPLLRVEWWQSQGEGATYSSHGLNPTGPMDVSFSTQWGIIIIIFKSVMIDIIIILMIIIIIMTIPAQEMLYSLCAAMFILEQARPHEYIPSQLELCRKRIVVQVFWRHQRRGRETAPRERQVWETFEMLTTFESWEIFLFGDLLSVDLVDLPSGRHLRSWWWKVNTVVIITNIFNITNIIYAAQVSADVTFLSIPGLPTSRT